MVKQIAACLFVICVTTFINAPAADAQFVGGAGPNLAIPLGETADGTSLGWGFKGRVGYELPNPFFDLSFDLIGGWASLPADPPDIGNADLNITQIMAGVRIGMGLLISPSVFAAGGYGWVSGEGSDYVLDHSGFTVVVGAGLDYSVIPLLDIGLIVGYNQVLTDSGHETVYTFLDVGIQASFSF